MGGAVGDALGAAVEFDRLRDIRARFGPEGVRDFAEAYGRVGAITDDTQMTLFSAEGLLRAYLRHQSKGISHPPSLLHHAYLRWYFTQGYKPQAKIVQREKWPDGWLIKEERLFSQRAPGNTCLSALSATKKLGQPAKNDSKGCGTVMRVAPFGLALNPERAYLLAAESSALTHGHPTGIIAGGAFALLIAFLVEGSSLLDSVEKTRTFIAEKPNSRECLQALDAAISLAQNSDSPSPEKVESLGEAWIAEEALSIALYCALVATSFEHGVLLAVNHSGDSDSTASMAAQLLGLIHGPNPALERWASRVELRDLLETIATDLAAMRAGIFDVRSNWERYPGW